MLLRRVIDHVKNQNWTAVTLDFVIVVIGVFIGIQVSNWNDVRQERRDEARFYHQLHSDIMLAEEASARTLASRLENLDFMIEVLDIIANESESDHFNRDQCKVMVESAIIDIRVPDLGAFNELISSGRAGIIRDNEIRSKLFGLQQSAGLLRESILLYADAVVPLDLEYPHLIEVNAYFDEDDQTVRSRSRCDSEGILNDRSFLNALNRNINIYEAFANRTLRPWGERLADVHARIDSMLEVVHQEEDE